jgi:hypothetical protein
MAEIKTIEYNGTLFRANKNLYNANKLVYSAAAAKPNMLASVNYKNAPTKYFTIKKNNVNAYTKKGTTYTKNWNTVRTLNLVDILDLDTRMTLEDIFRDDEIFINTITKVFPIDGTIVRRISSNSKEDNRVLEKICELGYDGYYMDVEGRNIGFHSEIGLCNKAFNKLKLMKNVERKTVYNNNKKGKSRRKKRLVEDNTEGISQLILF